MVMFNVVSYDNSDDDRRREAHDILVNGGTCVQYSVFERELEPGQLTQLPAPLSRLVRRDEDHLPGTARPGREPSGA